MAPCQERVEVWHEELNRCDNIDIDSHGQSLSLQVVIYTIEEGVSRDKIRGDGMEGEKRRRAHQRGPRQA